MMSSSDSYWLTTLQCSASNTNIIQPSDTFMQVLQWLRFIFFSPCPQRLVFSSIDFLFLFILILFVLQKLLISRRSSNNPSSSSINTPLLGNHSKGILHVKVDLWFKLTFISAALLAVLYVFLSILLLMGSEVGNPTSWKQTEVIFRIAQGLTQVVILVLVAHEQRFHATAHPMSLRIYWVANFVVVFCFSISAITRFVESVHGHGRLDSYLRMDDVVSLISLPISFFLLLVASKESSGITVIEEPENGLYKREEFVDDPNISDYGKANLFSKTTWLWMNPVINKGYNNPLNIEDVPSLPPDHQAEIMSELFEANWPKPGGQMKHPVAITLIKCFWRSIVFTGFLALIKLAVMYVGPVLIQSFVSFTSGEASSPYEGYYLVLTLLVAKIAEVLSSHHFNFHSQRIGLLIRSTLITALYKKGLKLSCSSRQNHGVGQIVNYMAVDAQQLGDLMNQLHSIWLMPLQLLVALALLYFYMGVSTMAALLGIVAILGYVMYRTKQCNGFQYQVMRNRDSRLKAMNEMINNMRVIKFQAWEDYFQKRIQSFRKLEYGWLSKFGYTVSSNMSLLFSTPVVLSVLVFGAAIWTGIYLDAATVFTATTIMKILQEPVRSFPQSLIQISQAMISLGRLDGYLMSPELDQGSVERDEGCGDGIAVEVKQGSFSWEDAATEGVVKEINLRVKKGELAAIVGTVGSGKSSLLAAIMGEMHKISGKVWSMLPFK